MRDSLMQYNNVQENIKSKISSGEYGAGDRIPSERKLCELFSVSRTTVRKAIEELVRTNYLIKRHGKGTFVVNGKSTEKKENGNILFIRCVHNETPSSSLSSKDIYPDILSGIEDSASQHNYHCLFNTINIDNPDREAISQLVSEAEGIIWGGELHNEDFLDYLLKTGLPVVLVSPSIKVDYVDSVNIDNEFGAYKGVKHLLENGHQRIAYIAGSPESFPSRERQRGYEEALHESGIEIDYSLILGYGWSY